jgi:hypothetical protein
VTEQLANDEMVQGYLDGYNLIAPEPTGNRSNSYRHGFMVARLDKGIMAHAYWPAEHLRKLADEAMEADEPRGI